MPFETVPNTEIISAVMNDIVDAVVQVYQDAGVDIPDRRVFTVGETAPHDCEQISVSLDQLYIGGPGDQAEQPMRCEAPRTIVLTVQLVRCIPTPKNRMPAPTPEAMQLSTEQLTADFWLLMEGIMSAESVNWLGALVDIETSPPSGGYQAVQANVVVGVP